MPLYEYQCEKCGVRFERTQHITEDSLCTCPECRGRVYRVMQPVGIIFKGSGFYCTDHRTSSSTALPGERSSTSKADSKSEPKSEEHRVETKTEKTAE